MRISFGKYVYYTSILLLIPSILLVSWINVFNKSTDYSAMGYLNSFLVPSLVCSVTFAILSYLFLGKYVHYTAQKVFFTLFGLLTIFLVIRYGVEFFGLNPIFITLNIPQQDAENYKIANQYYSISLPFTLFSTFILYLLSGLLLGNKK